MFGRKRDLVKESQKACNRAIRFIADAKGDTTKPLFQNVLGMLVQFRRKNDSALRARKPLLDEFYQIENALRDALENWEPKRGPKLAQDLVVWLETWRDHVPEVRPAEV